MAGIVRIESGLIGPRLGRSVSIDQAALLLHVSRRTIYNRIREGRLTTIRTIGGSQRVLVDSLNELGTSSQMPPSPVTSFAVRTGTGN